MQCKKCKQDLELTQFDKWKTDSNKYQPYCRDCNRIRIKDYMRIRRGLINEAGPVTAACEGCGSSDKLLMDHCHTSGKFRGWLCTRCNMAIGILHDNINALRKLADYLENSS